MDQSYVNKVEPIKRFVISCSGGMDSTCLLLQLLTYKPDSIDIISFNYGQTHKLELQRLLVNVHDLAIKFPEQEINYKNVDISSIMGTFSSSLTDKNIKMPEGHYEEENMKLTVVPNRNAIFSSILFGKALSISKENNNEPVGIALGVHSGDHNIYPDCRLSFYLELEKVFRLGNWDADSVLFFLPYIQSDKYGILKSALHSCEILGLDFDTILRNTNTSYEPDHLGRASGKTGADIERILAFHKLGRIDPVEYQDPWKVVVERALEMEKQHQLGGK